LPPGTIGPVVTDFPIWWAEAERSPALALPDEPPGSVIGLTLAFPGTQYLVLGSDPRGLWPAILSSGIPGADCFERVNLPTPADPADRTVVEGARIYRISCR